MRKRLAMTLTISIILLSFTLMNVKIVCSSEAVGEIDIFTQKIPFSGIGVNQSSDAFQPQELVILYALVTYNEAPIANKLVAFQINNPANPFQNMTVVGASSTNQSGIAQFSFRIPWPSENAEQIIFGEWFAIATVEIVERVIVDTLTFQVGWIIKVTNIKTLNANLEPQTKYLREEVIVFNLTIENIALTSKSATIIINAQDAASYPITYLELDNIVFQPGENHANASSQILTTAAIGEATVSAAAYTASPKMGGVPYSPAALSTFEIIIPPVKRYYLTVRTDPFGIVPISGEGWYDEGTNVLLTAPEYGSILSGARYKFSYWDVDGTPKSGNPITVAMDANHTATAHYILQYYLTVISLHGIPSGEGWYDNGTTAYATLNTGIVDHGNGTRRVFISWSGDASGTSYAQSDPILMDGPKTAVANWKSQDRLTIRTNGLGTKVTSIYNNSAVLGTATDGTPYVGWFDQNVVLQLDVDGLIREGSTKYVFNLWTGDALGSDRPLLVTMHSPKNITANYKTQYEVIFTQTGLDSSATDTVLIIDGVPRTFGEIPYIIWVDGGTLIAYSYNDVSCTLQGKRFILTAVTGPASPITVTGPVTVTGNYKTQYYLTVRTDPSGIATIQGEKWYDESTNVTLTAPTVQNYDFNYWSVDGISQGDKVNTITETMNAPHTAIAHYSLHAAAWYVPDWFYWFILLLLVIIILLIAWLYRRRRKKKAGDAFYKGWTAWYYGYDLRNKISGSQILSSRFYFKNGGNGSFLLFSLFS